MGVKTMLTAGLTAVAIAGGATWGYMHYVEIFGEGCASSCTPTSCCSQVSTCTDTESCCESASTETQPAAAKECCEAPSRQGAVAKQNEND
jgi:hypothetical protein